ncbi:MAG: hypothetical protein M1833_005163 [Piccolia ochrophora]|nr:MAG: hypothetical protein M1833_005163 [Piccolia ochrophora]
MSNVSTFHQVSTPHGAEPGSEVMHPAPSNRRVSVTSGLTNSGMQSHYRHSLGYGELGLPRSRGTAGTVPGTINELDDKSLSSGSPASSDSHDEGVVTEADTLRLLRGSQVSHQTVGSDLSPDSSDVMRINALLGDESGSLPANPPRSFPVGVSPLQGISASEPGPRCSYTDNCTTGSPLRKVVSHIFGRNKLCTRQIPKGVWVHYCRKHYQRSRYRNPKGFALLQCDLVRKQVDRLQHWGGVRDWIVKVRKREEMRLNKENAQLAAGRHGQDDGSGDGDDLYDRYDASGVSGQGGSVGSSRWLVRSTGPGKTTSEVLEILDRIEQEIAETGSNFPDVEILPNVVTEKARPSSSTSATSRRTASVGATETSPKHSRSKSESLYALTSLTHGLLNRDSEFVDAQRKRKVSSGSSQLGVSAANQQSVELPDPKRRVRTMSRGRFPRQQHGDNANLFSADLPMGEDQSKDTLLSDSPVLGLPDTHDRFQDGASGEAHLLRDRRRSDFSAAHEAFFGAPSLEAIHQTSQGNQQGDRGPGVPIGSHLGLGEPGHTS